MAENMGQNMGQNMGDAMGDTIDWQEIGRRFAEPFDPADVDFRIQGKPNERTGKGQVVVYVDARTVQHRLDAVVGPGNWTFDWDPVVLDKEVRIAKGILTVFGVAKADVGDASSFDPSKGCVSDALKRAAVQWGIGRYLYAIPSAYVAPEEGGQRIPKATLQQLRARLPRPASPLSPWVGRIGSPPAPELEPAPAPAPPEPPAPAPAPARRPAPSRRAAPATPAVPAPAPAPVPAPVPAAPTPAMPPDTAQAIQQQRESPGMQASVKGPNWTKLYSGMKRVGVAMMGDANRLCQQACGKTWEACSSMEDYEKVDAAASRLAASRGTATAALVG